MARVKIRSIVSKRFQIDIAALIIIKLTDSSTLIIVIIIRQIIITIIVYDLALRCQWKPTLLINKTIAALSVDGLFVSNE